tara:strand:+ start:13918 stop:14187 length:270 start_codon:yes stop_codon:yes gene_type:complete
MAEINVKKDKVKVNDGGHKPFGVDLDPDKNLTHITNPDGSTEAYYKDSKMDYNDYIDELQTRTERNAKGKDFTSRAIGYFSGFDFKNKK